MKMCITDLQALVVASEAQEMRVTWELFPSCIQIGAGPRGGAWRHLERVAWARVCLPTLHDVMSIAVDRALVEAAGHGDVRPFNPARVLRAIDGGRKE